MRTKIIAALAALTITGAVAPAAQAYSLNTREAKRVLRSLLNENGYHVDSTREWYCGNRTSKRVSCDLYFYDYGDGEVYCGGGTVVEYAYRYVAHWSLGTDCDSY